MIDYSKCESWQKAILWVLTPASCMVHVFLKLISK